MPRSPKRNRKSLRKLASHKRASLVFRQKLLQRPLALRCGTEYVQPHEMCRVVERYLDGPCDSPSHQLRQLSANDDPTDSEHITAVTQLWCEIFDNEETWLTTSVCATCFAILWLAIKGEGVSSMVAITLDAAAGLAQRQKWGLMLPSSARVSLLTYQTVLGVRYPELVKATADGWQYGRYVGYLMELRATHSDPSRCRRQISSFAKTLTVRVATYLAKEIAALPY